MINQEEFNQRIKDILGGPWYDKCETVISYFAPSTDFSQIVEAEDKIIISTLKNKAGLSYKTGK